MDGVRYVLRRSRNTDGLSSSLQKQREMTGAVIQSRGSIVKGQTRSASEHKKHFIVKSFCVKPMTGDLRDDMIDKNTTTI